MESDCYPVVETVRLEKGIRRELSDNFCFYNAAYDTLEGFPLWSRTTLREHARDEREYLYSLKQFESATTHDPLWNAAQVEMVNRGENARIHENVLGQEYSGVVENARRSFLYSRLPQ